MGILQGIIVGFKEIWAHKLRSLLTMLGVILGVAALASMFAFVEGMFSGWKQYIDESGGIEKLTCQSERIPQDQQPYRFLSRQRRLTDITAIANNCNDITAYSPEVDLPFETVLRYRNKTVWTRISGVTQGVLPINNYEMAMGRFISDLDRIKRSRVVVLGTYPADELFGMYAPAIGQRIQIKGESFRVIGLLKHYEASSGGGGGRNFMDWKNRVAYIPLETAMTLYRSNKDLTSLSIEVYDSERVPIVAEILQNILFITHRRVLSFTVRTNEEMIERFSEITGAFGLTLGIIAGIALVVGGIGIMNIMLASINERIREIGIRKAIGARDRDILIQVIVESVVLSLLGGIFGVLVSLFLTHTIGVIIRESLSAPVIRAAPLVFASSISVIIGISFGLYPALKASKLDPIEALRYE